MTVSLTTMGDRFAAGMTGPVKHLAAERARLSQLSWELFDVRPLGSTLGAQISGIDLRQPIGDDVVAELQRALAEYKVVFFRNQPFTPAEHVAFAQRFGELELHPFLPPNADNPELVRFEKSADNVGYENLWHHDVTWRERPSKAAILHAVQVPQTGGDTVFSDSCAAYDGLTDEIKELIDTAEAEHDFVYAFGRNLPAEQLEQMRQRYPVVRHPVAPVHDVTGRRHLFVNPAFTTSIVGMDLEPSEALLRHLFAQSAVVEYQYRFTWQDDSVAWWDNRAVQHYAASDYWPDVRIMERASIVGGRPAR